MSPMREALTLKSGVLHVRAFAWLAWVDGPDSEAACEVRSDCIYTRARAQVAFAQSVMERDPVADPFAFVGSYVCVFDLADEWDRKLLTDLAEKLRRDAPEVVQ